MQNFFEEFDLDGVIGYRSTYDGSYIGVNIDMLQKRGIDRYVQAAPGGRTACIGYNSKEKCWYGWSHRAIAKFEVGTECGIRACHFDPSTPEEMLQKYLNYVEFATVKKVTGQVLNGKIRIEVTHINDQLTGEDIPFPEKWGRGRWECKDLNDAKEMARAFAESVS